MPNCLQSLSGTKRSPYGDWARAEQGTWGQHRHLEGGTRRAHPDTPWDMYRPGVDSTGPSHIGLPKNESADVHRHICGTQNPCRCTHKFPPGHKQNREDIFILTKDTHMKTDIDTQTRVHTNPIHTKNGAHRDMHGQKADAPIGTNMYVQTRAQACRKSMETQRKKLLDTQKDYTGDHRDSGNRYIERGLHVQSQR